jgi:ribosome-binding factor A
MPAAFKRTDRVNKQLARLLAEILQHKPEDERLKQVNVTRVKVSPDLRSAKVFYTVITPTPDIDKALANAKGYLRAELSRSMTTVRITPELHFYYDDTMDQIKLIESLINKPPV